MSTHHRHKRGRRVGHRPPGLASGLAEQPGQPLPSPRVSMSFNAQPGHPFAPAPFRPGAHTRQESSFQTHAFPLPGMYPWSTPPIPSTPVKPSPLGNSTSASASASKSVPGQPPSQEKGYFTRVHQRSPPNQTQELPTKRQRHRQIENGIGLGRPSRLSVSVTASQAARAARSATAPGGSAVPVRQPFGPSSNPADGPPPFANGARKTWALDPSARATLGHFPHSSLSLPLSGQPLPRHGARQSVSNPGGAFFGPRKTHTSHLSRSHERTPSIPHRVGPPPKAILGGPGGKTFEELRVPSPSRLTPAPPSPTAAAASDAPRPASPIAQNGDISSPPKPTLREPFEIKHGGTTVRVALPPDEYDPPDTPAEDQPVTSEEQQDTEAVGGESSATPDDEAQDRESGAATGAEEKPAGGQEPRQDIEEGAEADAAGNEDTGEEAPSQETAEEVAKPAKAPRKEAFPWPERRVASPKSIPLPPSPLEDEQELSDVESWLAHDTPHGSVDISSSWNGKAVRVSMPPESWEALRAKTMSPGSTEPSALYEDAVDEVELALDVEMAEPTPPGSDDEVADRSAPGTARSLPIHLRAQSNATATEADTADTAGEMSSQSQRRHANLSLSSNPFLQRSLGGILRSDGRENRSNAPSPVSAAFPQRGELPDWYHDPTMQNTPSPNQSNFVGSQGFPQQGFLPEWSSSMLSKSAEAGDKENAPEVGTSEEGEGWGTPQSTPGKDHGHSATKTETEISESLWPSSSASKADEEPSLSPTSSTADDIVVSVQVTSGPAKESSSISDDRTVIEDKDLIKLDSDTPSTDTVTRERLRPKVATGFLQRQLQSIMRSDKSKAKSNPPTPAAPATRETEPSTSPSPDVPPTPPPTQEYHAGLTPSSEQDHFEESREGQGRDSASESGADNDENARSDSSDGEDNFVDSPSSPFKPASHGGERRVNGGDVVPRPNNPSIRGLSPLNKLKPGASVFVPRAIVTSPPRMMPAIDAPPPKVEEQRPPSVTSSTFTFGYPSTVERKLSLASTSSPRNPSKVLASLPSLQPSAPAFKPTAPVFQPASVTSSLGAVTTAQPETGSGGALGLFTFTHNLRPTAAEFRPNGVRGGTSPLRHNQALRPHPPDLDLSKADPTSKPFQLPSALFPSNEGKIEIGNGEVSLVLPVKRAVKMERPEPQAASLPRRNQASPRQHSQKERESASDVEAASDDERESPRRRKHTAKRSSQNSYLPKTTNFPKTPASPEKKGEDINIYPSQPVKAPSTQPAPDTPSAATHQKRPSLNPTAKPFVFGQGSFSSPASTQLHDSNTFSGASKRAASGGVQVADASRFRTWVFPTSASNSSAAKSTQKRRYSDSGKSSGSDIYDDRSPATGMHGLDTAAVEAMQGDMDGGDWSDWPGSPPRLNQLQAVQTGESIEFPLRRDSGQAIEVIKPTNDSSSSNSPLSTPSDVAIEQGLAAEILDKLDSLEQQLASVKSENERIIEEAFDRVDVVHESSAVRALNALRDNLPTSTKALENVAAVLISHSTLLKEIQEAVNENLITDDRSSRSSSRSSDVVEGDTTLVNNNNTAIQELLIALQTGQKAMMDKISISTQSAAITELREVKEALLEWQARETKADDAKAKEIAELKQILKEERSRRELADSKAAVLRSQVDALKKRHDINDEAWRTSILTEVTTASAKVKIIQASETEAQQELVIVREELSKQSELLQAMKEERDTASEIAKQRHEDATLLQKEMASFHSSFFERLDSLTVPGGGDPKRIKTLEAQLASAQLEIKTCREEMCDLRVQLAEARAGIELEREKGLRAGENHATDARTLDLQLKAEKARGAFLDSKVQKAEAELAAVTQNLDVWRSAALEQRLRAEQGAVHIAAMQQENFHWREFALGADRHRLEQWLSTRPFEGLDHVTRPNTATKAAPSVVSSDTPTPRAPAKAPSALAPPIPTKAAEHPPPVPPKAAVTPKLTPRIVEPVPAT